MTLQKWLSKGKFVQAYTRRGSPRTGIHSKRWVSNGDNLFEAVVIVLFLVLMALFFMEKI